MNGEKVGEAYFTPGFSSYHHQIQYQTYDVTDRVADTTEIHVTVGDGWAVGSYTMRPKTKTYADRQHIEYSDGSTEVIGAQVLPSARRPFVTTH